MWEANKPAEDFMCDHAGMFIAR